MTRPWREPPRWLWVFAGVLLVWGATVLVTGGRGAGAIVTAAMAYGVFYVVVGIGQMIVITTGPGNIDLSIPSTMILAGYLAMGQMHGLDAGLVPGVALGLAVGFAVGVGNVVLIQLLRIPPIIATLAAGFVVQSAAIAYSRGSTAKPAPMLVDFMVTRFAGIPALTMIFVAAAILVAFIMQRSTFGRSVVAIGQNRRAAWLAGVAVPRTMASVYILSGTLAGLGGVLLSAYSGGASLDMAEEFLLSSIAVVVLGGTSIAGGRPTVAGVWGAALFLYLLVTMLNVFRVDAGVRYVLTGLIIIGVLAVAGGEQER